MKVFGQKKKEKTQMSDKKKICLTTVNLLDFNLLF
jgi:hypothetical protein